MRYSEIICESSRAPLYHGIQLKYAVQALTANELLGTTTQRWWPDGKRRKDNEPDYQDSYWMKGLSLTRDRDYAMGWGDVVFILDQDLLSRKFKIIPFNWMFSIPNSSSRKKEREEFLVTKMTPDTYMRELDQDDIEAGVKPIIDMDKFTAPGGKVANLSMYLKGIMISDDAVDAYGADSPMVKTIMTHPKFISQFNKTETHDRNQRSAVKVR